MKISEFDYELPPGMIAQEPAAERDASRLMVLDRRTGSTRHAAFRDLPGLLRPGDLLVLNDTRVIPARLLAEKPGGGTAEVLLLERVGGGDESGEGGRGGRGERGGERPGRRQEWRALVRGFPRREGDPGLEFSRGLRVIFAGREPGGEIARVILDAEGEIEPLLERAGRMPTPPYIRRDLHDRRLDRDRRRYQTVYAARPGAVAAPTAGLHFTEDLLKRIEDAGIGVEALTLHVGYGTFQPVRSESLEEHRMHSERFAVSGRLARAAEAARRRGGRIVAVGTTVVRALEHSADENGAIRAGSGLCDLFIRPGHRFRAVDALITNFHLPRSTLLVLVAAFAGLERTLSAYREAVERGYRFYSYGDAMVIL